MAGRAIVIEIVIHVIGVGDTVEITLVTGITFYRCILIPIRMTGDTLQAHMRPGQRELGVGMIE